MMRTLLLFTIAAGAIGLSGCAKTKQYIHEITSEDSADTSVSSSADSSDVPSTKPADANQSAPPAVAARLPNVKSNISFPPSGDFWYLKSSKLVEIESELMGAEGSIGQAFKQLFLFSFKDKAALIAQGTKAFERIFNPKPEFYTRDNPANFALARFTTQPDRNRRYVWIVSLVGSNVLTFEDAVPFDYAKTSQGTYKLILREPMAPGEYAIVKSGGSNKFYMHAFGIESKVN